MKKKLPAGVYNLLDQVEMHLGNFILNMGIQDGEPEYEVWKRLQKLLDGPTKPGCKRSPK